MMSPISIAVSGLMASGTRMANSANNVANIHSTTSLKNGVLTMEPHKPLRTMQSSIEPTGGTRAVMQAKDPATIKLYDPDNIAADAEGLTEYPNVSLEEEVIDQQFAKYDFKANLNVIKTYDEMLGSLLDIES